MKNIIKALLNMYSNYFELFLMKKKMNVFAA